MKKKKKKKKKKMDKGKKAKPSHVRLSCQTECSLSLGLNPPRLSRIVVPSPSYFWEGRKVMSTNTPGRSSWGHMLPGRWRMKKKKKKKKKKMDKGKKAGNVH
jgi:hypothetical protein